MEYIDFEAEVESLVEPEVAAWDQFERYVSAAFDADKSPEEAADEVADQYNEHC